MRTLHNLGSVTAVGREVSGYRLYTVGVQVVRWDKKGNVKVRDFLKCKTISKCIDNCSSFEVLSFSFHWLCSVDTAVCFVGLMFKRQENESAYGKSVTVTERVLCFYCYWLCWVDIAVGLLV